VQDVLPKVQIGFIVAQIHRAEEPARIASLEEPYTLHPVLGFR